MDLIRLANSHSQLSSTNKKPSPRTGKGEREAVDEVQGLVSHQICGTNQLCQVRSKSLAQVLSTQGKLDRGFPMPSPSHYKNNKNIFPLKISRKNLGEYLLDFLCRFTSSSSTRYHRSDRHPQHSDLHRAAASGRGGSYAGRLASR